MAKTAEGKVKDAVKAMLIPYGSELRAWWPVPSGYGESTIDLHIVFRGRHIAVEVKKFEGETTALQRKFLRDNAKAGGISIVVEGAEDPKDMPRNLRTLSTILTGLQLGTEQEETEVHW